MEGGRFILDRVLTTLQMLVFCYRIMKEEQRQMRGSDQEILG